MKTARPARRLAVLVGVMLLHIVAWQLLSQRAPRPSVPAPRVLTTLRLLPAPPLPTRPPSNHLPQRQAPIPRETVPEPAIAPPRPQTPVATAPQAIHPPQAAASQAPLDLDLHPGWDRPGPVPQGHARRDDSALAADPGVNVGSRINEKKLNDGRRRITLDGKCFETQPTRSAQLDPYQPGMLRDLQMVKPCD